MKPEFTNTPPFGILRTQPVLNAARELQFDNPLSDLSDVSPQETKYENQSDALFKHTVKPVQLDLSRREPATPDHGVQPGTPLELKQSITSEVGELTDSFSKPDSICDMDTRPRDNSGASQTEPVCIDNLSQVIESLENESKKILSKILLPKQLHCVIESFNGLCHECDKRWLWSVLLSPKSDQNLRDHCLACHGYTVIRY